VDIKALTINEAVSAGLRIARDVLGSVDRYCMYEGSGEIVIEYWRSREVAVKLIHADDPASALIHYYNAERVGLVKCVDIGQ
jgi:hypothetical protein